MLARSAAIARDPLEVPTLVSCCAGQGQRNTGTELPRMVLSLAAPRQKPAPPETEQPGSWAVSHTS